MKSQGLRFCDPEYKQIYSQVFLSGLIIVGDHLDIVPASQIGIGEPSPQLLVLCTTIISHRFYFK
jgi:hypothetical protein